VPLGDNAHRGLAKPRRVAVEVAGYVIGLAFAGLAAVRGGKAVHPHGAVYAAELMVPSHHDALGRTELFGTPGRRPALVRFSRSLGLPRPLRAEPPRRSLTGHLEPGRERWAAMARVLGTLSADDVKRVAVAALDDGKDKASKKPGLTALRAVGTGAVL
jgi:hypothetical protein